MATCPGFTWRYLHTAALNLAVAVGALHAKGYVIGDLNESNDLVHGSAMVSLVDSDIVSPRRRVVLDAQPVPVGPPLEF